MTANPILNAHAVLAEGPVWHQNELWWVDIERGEIHALNPTSGADRVWRFPHKIGFVVPTVHGDFLIGTERGIARFHPNRPELSFVADPESSLRGNRFNDAKCDPAGRLWAGTMALDESPCRGSLYRINPDLQVRRMIGGVSISNGLGWSPDGTTLYFIDSPTRRIEAFELDPTSGRLGPIRTVADVTDGSPDGMAVDREGRLWVAIWGGWCVACFDPATGNRVAEVAVPAEAVTSCCFGPGETLFITSASRDVPPEARDRQPLAGAIFQAEVGTSGPIPPPFAG